MYVSDDGNPSPKGNTKTVDTKDNNTGKNTTGGKLGMTLAQHNTYVDLMKKGGTVKTNYTDAGKDMLENYKETATGIITTKETDPNWTGKKGAETKDLNTTIYGLPKMVVYGGGAVITLAILYFILKD
jgi:hypothetical protein